MRGVRCVAVKTPQKKMKGLFDLLKININK